MSRRIWQPFLGVLGRWQDVAHPNGCEHLHLMKAGRLGQVTRAWMTPAFMPPCNSVTGLMDASTALYTRYAPQQLPCRRSAPQACRRGCLKRGDSDAE